MNKKIVTIYFADDWNREGDPISSVPTRKSFEDLHERGMKNGVEIFRASIQWYDSEKEIFKKGWGFRDGKWIRFENEIKPDLIFDKVGGARDFELFDLKMKMSKGIKVFNHPMLRTLLDNKLSQYIALGEFMPKTLLATDETELIEILKEISTSKVVLKPPYGSGGNGILILEKNVVGSNNIEYPVLVQEFIKNEQGIPGFSKDGEVADLRMVFFNHELRYALSRIAKKGSLFTNFHQGASAVMVPVNKIPDSAFEVAEKIVKKLSVFKKAQYSLDFMFNFDGKPLLVEMNTTPGIDLVREFGGEDLLEGNFRDLESLL